MSGKKKGNKKGTTIPLNDFLLSADAETNWADVEDDIEVTPAQEYSDSAPAERRGESYPRRDDRDYDRTSRGDRDFDAPRRDRPSLPVPDRGPFVAFVGNLSFSATEDDIGNFFAEHCGVESVRLISDPETGRSKGFGYVTFTNRESLVVALEATGVEIHGRGIRVDVAEGRQSEDRRGPSKADLVDKWERGKSVPASNRRDERDPRGDRERGRGFGSDYRGRTRDEPRQERKPLNLQPRSNTSTVGGPAQTKGSNPFGDAKPRDEAKFQEERKKREEERKAAQAKRAEPRAETRVDTPSTRGRRGGRGGNEGSGRDFASARSNMGKKPEVKASPTKSSGDKKPKQGKAPTVQKESSTIVTTNIYSALQNQDQ